MRDYSELLSHVDHTLLTPTATWEEVRQLCDEGVRYGCASVCIPPCYVGPAAEYLKGSLPVCTVIGFPNGYCETAVKVCEAREAVRRGASELDMVLNLGRVRSGDWDAVLEEIQAVRSACPEQVLKVIIETCLLTREEKLRLAELVSRSGADYIKTSTGFAGGGATRGDVAMLRAHCAPHLKIKASGGIATLADAEDLIALGADRIGASRLVRAVAELES